MLCRLYAGRYPYFWIALLRSTPHTYSLYHWNSASVGPPTIRPSWVVFTRLLRMWPTFICVWIVHASHRTFEKNCWSCRVTSPVPVAVRITGEIVPRFLVSTRMNTVSGFVLKRRVRRGRHHRSKHHLCWHPRLPHHLHLNLLLKMVNEWTRRTSQDWFQRSYWIQKG